MSNLAYRVGVVTIAALLAGPALADGGQSRAPQGVAAFDGSANSAYPGNDDGSVVNPDGDEDVDGADSGGDQDGADDGGNSGAPDTYPA